MFTLKVLTGSVLPDESAYRLMTFPAYRPLLGQLATNPRLVAVAAIMGAHPVGLALGEIQALNRKAGHVLSLYTLPPARGLGVGTALLRALEVEFLQQRCIWLTGIYQAGKPTTPTLERLLEYNDWAPPVLNSRTFKIRRDIAATMPWMQRFWPAPPYETFLWRDLTPAERAWLQDADWYPPVLSPFKSEANLDPASSIGIRYKGEIVGWAITHRLRPDTVCLSTLFVRESAAGRRCGILLIAECSRLMAASDVVFGLWMIYAVNTSVTRFVQTHCGPYLESVQENYLSSKLLEEGEKDAIAFSLTQPETAV